MKILLASVGLFITTSCGTLDQQPEDRTSPSPTATPSSNKVQQRMLNFLLKNVTVDFELYPHVVEFVTSCSLVGGEFTNQCEKRLMALDKIEMVDAFENSPNVVGRCYYGRFITTPRTVQILKGYVDSDSLSMKGLVFHELGHCLLGQDHTAANSIDIMSPYVMQEEEYGAYWKTLVKGLFDPNRLPNEKYDLDLSFFHQETVEDIGERK